MKPDDRTPGRRFTVERRGKPDTPYQPGMYASRPGDARRQGRVEADGAPVLRLAFVDVNATIEARLGVICVARITINPTGGYLWVCDLPMLQRHVKPASDIDKAKAAIDYQIRQWCEAAGLISAKRKGAT